ncbi:MAG: amidase [Rhizobacter sp.]|nr:amidase [Rhizobacter sp.]
MTQACDLSALEARRSIGAKTLSPVELFDSCERRIAQRNGELNAFVALDLDAARAAARAAEDDVVHGRPLGLLHGLPIGVKDMEATRGLRTTWGSTLHKDFVPDEDELHIGRIRRAGGIVIGKTNVPEFGAGSNTVNPVYGATGNPFDSSKTCGGSSGGSAVALAAGMVPLATGSDFGGSLRTPAAFCGVVGFRPSPGLVPFPARSALLLPMTVLGPMARSVADAHLLLMPQLGRDRGDPFSSEQGREIPQALVPADLSALRAAFSTDLGCAPMDAGIAQVFEAKSRCFQHVFRSHEKRDPDFDGALETFEVVRGVNLVANFGDTVAKHRDTLGHNIVSGVDMGQRLSVQQIARAQVSQSRIYQRFMRLFDEVDALICPTAAVSPFPHSLLFPDTINGVKLPTYMSWYGIAYLLSLALPSIVSLPCGLDHQGMPFGIQVVGPMGSDAKVLSIALAIEQELARHEPTRRPVPEWARG